MDGADPYGRRVAPVRLDRGEWRPFALARTLPPPWTAERGDGGAFWRREYDGAPVRPTIIGRCDGHEPWADPIEVLPTD